MEKFMTKAQRKRETQPLDDRFISSNYNRHRILNDIEPFTEDILQGRPPVAFNCTLMNF